jgi:predicted DCC family thiol-disulfide oxidoreductase YuxK
VSKPSSEPSGQENHPIVLYDGVCGLCNRAVQFILKRDPREAFRFASLQSDFAAKILQKHGISSDALDTVYLVLHYGDPTERLLARSNAGLAVMVLLGGAWRLLALVGGVFPKLFLDFLYNLIARNRYRIFGKYESCPLPTADQRAKFLDQ